MVCAKCQKLVKQTQLATPEVKKKNEMYFGSPASGSGASTKSTSGLKGAGVTLGSTGVSKVCATTEVCVKDSSDNGCRASC